jgi:hypothetical protein
MTSVFTTNSGIEKPGSGDQSGQWGDTVNTNMDIVDVLTNGVIGLTLTGATSTLATADGQVSDGQYKVLVLSSALSALHTITVTPNDAQKLYLVNNTTSHEVQFSQGSGANAVIDAGRTAIIYCNGGGASAVVTALSNSLQISGGSITATPITNSAISATTLTTSGQINLGGTVLAASATEINTVADSDTAVGTTAVAGGDGIVMQDIGTDVMLQTSVDTLDTYLSATAKTLTNKTLTTPIMTTATISGGTANWTVTAAGTNLTFAYGGVNKMRLDSSGNITVIGNVTAYGVIS